MRFSTAFLVAFAAVTSATATTATTSFTTNLPGPNIFATANQTFTATNATTVTVSCPAYAPCTMSMPVASQATLQNGQAMPSPPFSNNTASLVTFVTHTLPCPPGMACRVAGPTAMPSVQVEPQPFINTTAVGMGQPSLNQTAVCNMVSTNCVLTTNMFTTITVAAFTTYCPSPTVFATVGQTFTVTAATIVTVSCPTSAPCIVSMPVAGSTAASAMPAVPGTGMSSNGSASGNSSSPSITSMTGAGSNSAGANSGASGSNAASGATSSGSGANAASTTGFMMSSDARKLATSIVGLIVIAGVALAF